ncbi:uncharacterized protein Eint_081560 [Encephalitozoon intestinalis ATCC 50506]|uniref:Tetratricopeptide repeat protein n=1 Tax=Encephalitozoon intestinalis (strain ATCC 50506) TaxID=876142 RepID=E0S8N2_ENCIT|nr:uncharacterized protein Eint_081560 [Encephalitozoon intestinalis ATCC 50506]ADM12088.1 hypothetical protein Eint_081560 [Encephalitozoon intestinalis ATCC 50506]UTX45881.1 hypothetical protein GPK93_08g14600 [Encephalitozoon intestinalis]
MERVEKEISRKIDLCLYGEALQLIHSFPLSYESGISIYPYKGYVLYLQRRYEESVTFLKDLLKRFPSNIKAKRFLYLGLLTLGDFGSSFRIAKECWIDGDYRRSTLIRILAHSFVLKDFDFLGRLDMHCDEPLLLSMGYIYSGELERAVELMRKINDSHGSEIYLDSLISAKTRSVYMLDYVRYLDEEIFIKAIESLENKLKVFEGVEGEGCDYVDSKVLRIAKKVLSRGEYEVVEKNIYHGKKMKHCCQKECVIGKLRARAEEDMLLPKKGFRKPKGRYSELEGIFEEIRNGNIEHGLESLKRTYGKETIGDLEKHLKDGQNILVLNEVKESYLRYRKKEKALHYAKLEKEAQSLRVRDTIECLEKLMDESMVREIIEFLELDLFDK